MNLVECSNVVFIHLNPLTRNITLHLTIFKHFNIIFYTCALSMVTHRKKWTNKWHRMKTHTIFSIFTWFASVVFDRSFSPTWTCVVWTKSFSLVRSFVRMLLRWARTLTHNIQCTSWVAVYSFQFVFHAQSNEIEYENVRWRENSECTHKPAYTIYSWGFSVCVLLRIQSSTNSTIQWWIWNDMAQSEMNRTRKTNWRHRHSPPPHTLPSRVEKIES